MEILRASNATRADGLFPAEAEADFKRPFAETGEPNPYFPLILTSLLRRPPVFDELKLNAAVAGRFSASPVFEAKAELVGLAEPNRPIERAG
jgi:hypothetical protein